MRTSPWSWPWLCLAAAACGGGANERASAPGVVSVATADPAQSVGADAPVTSPTGDASASGAPRVLIDAGGVGVFRLGARVEESALGAEPERRFFARSIADMQEIEGFRIAGVPLAVAVRPRKGSAAHSLSLAKQGRLMVTALYVDGPGPATARGAGVGSRLADLERLYGSVAAHDVPPTWGHDECAASVPELANVWFYFESCDAARKGARVVRVSMFEVEVF